MFVQGSHAFAMFPPTRYVRGGATRAHKRDDLYQLFDKIEILAACLHCMVPLCTQLDYMVVFGQFFFLLSVQVALKLNTK